ncbi:MAG: SAM-dependent methyltransferase [Boseongicola sp.]|nr:SAM-dependent methyltransferase [Boseongicola sp.]
MTETPRLTDRRALELHRARAAKRPQLFLLDEAAADIEERLAEVKKSFSKPAIIGGLRAPFQKFLPHAFSTKDDEALKLERDTHDLVIHAMALHWADDPIGQLVQSRLAMKPDGLFIAAFFGGQTLHELRTVLAEAETRIKGGLSPRVLPMGDLRDLGGLLQRAGFALPVADSRSITVRYKSLQDLTRDLRGMGETNALATRHRSFPSKVLFSEAARLYQKHYSDNEGYLLATFELVFLTGWAPHESQPKPLRPGSATQRLSDALGTEERPSGDQVAPPGS